MIWVNGLYDLLDEEPSDPSPGLGSDLAFLDRLPRACVMIPADWLYEGKVHKEAFARTRVVLNMLRQSHHLQKFSGNMLGFEGQLRTDFERLDAYEEVHETEKTTDSTWCCRDIDRVLTAVATLEIIGAARRRATNYGKRKRSNDGGVCGRKAKAKKGAGGRR